MVAGGSHTSRLPSDGGHRRGDDHRHFPFADVGDGRSSSRYDFTSMTDTSSWPARTIGSCTGGAATTSRRSVAVVHADNGHVAGRDRPATGRPRLSANHPGKAGSERRPRERRPPRRRRSLGCAATSAAGGVRPAGSPRRASTAVQTAGPGSGGGLACHSRRKRRCPSISSAAAALSASQASTRAAAAGSSSPSTKAASCSGDRVRIGAIIPHKDVRWLRNARSFWRA